MVAAAPTHKAQPNSMLQPPTPTNISLLYHNNNKPASYRECRRQGRDVGVGEHQAIQDVNEPVLMLLCHRGAHTRAHSSACAMAFPLGLFMILNITNRYHFHYVRNLNRRYKSETSLPTYVFLYCKVRHA
jgi:hypothetical protein